MTSRERRRARLRYWAVVYRGRDAATGYVHDFYPEEKASHRADLLSRRVAILGTFDTAAAAWVVVRRKIQRLADARNRRSGR